MQQTNFPYLCAIVDDASTDGEQEIIKDYLKSHFDLDDPSLISNEETDDYVMKFARHKTNQNCYFVTYFLKYNHRSLKKAKIKHLKKWIETVNYIALCEGDDYWTDPLKLQKQVDFLEKHPDYTMVCNRTKLYSEKKKTYIGENYCYNKNRTVKTKDVIYKSGLFISTCSIIYRKEIRDNYPDYCRKCVVGDYPLQIMAAMKGKIYYFNDTMSVYRIDNSESWMAKQKWRTMDESNIRRVESMINMFNGFYDNYPSYKKYFSTMIAMYLISQCPYKNGKNDNDIKLYKHHLKKSFDKIPIFWHILFKLSITNIPILRGYYVVYTRPIFKRFKRPVYIYNNT